MPASKRLAAPDRMFGEPKPTPGESQFADQNSDEKYYRLLNAKLLQKIPAPAKDPPRMNLQDVIGANAVQKIQKYGRIVFHSVGDTGATIPATPLRENAVTNKMAADFDEENQADVPSFLYHLGDVVYNFGEDEYYYDQFYDPFRNYNAPIFAIPGNHDGVVYNTDQAPTLAAFLQHFCSPYPIHAPQAGGLVRTTMTQPGVYFTLEAPFVTIIALYKGRREPGDSARHCRKRRARRDQIKNRQQ
jgi:Calcineurin-like phosphoesterase